VSDDFDAAAAARARRRRWENNTDPIQGELEVDRCVACGKRGDLLCDGSYLDGCSECASKGTDQGGEPCEACGGAGAIRRTCDAVLCRKCAVTPRTPVRGIVCSRGRGKGRGCQPFELRSDYCPECVEAGRVQGYTSPG